MKRGDFIKLTGMGTTAIFLGGGLSTFLPSCKKEGMMNMGGGALSVIEGDFSTLLPMPPVVTGQATLAAQATVHNIFKGKVSKVLGYQPNSILGPSIVVNSGDSVNILFQNNLAEPSNIHWHGLDIPANMDGHPKDTIDSGGSFNYQFVVSQRAAMYWYHPHPHELTAKQAYLGLAGAFIVRALEESSLNLPSGEFEVPLIIQDKRVFPDYSLDYSPQMGDVMTGYLGPYVTVNGVYAPSKEVKTRNYRLRVLNGSNARIYDLALSNGAAFAVIGSDGGLLASPSSVDSLLLGPGERVDLIVDFSSYPIGTELFLISNAFSAGTSQGLEEFKILKFIVDENDTDTFSLPVSLSVIDPIPESSAIKTRTFNISNPGMGGGGHSGMTMKGMHRINNKVYDENRVDETVQAGTTEIWVFDNSTGDEPHPMHMHALQFQVLDRTGGRNVKIATENGWKDTAMVLPGEKVRVIMTFGVHTGKYMLHCHNLEHEDDGMMLQVEVV